MLRTNAAWLVLLLLLSIAFTTRGLQIDVSVPDVVLLEPGESSIATDLDNFRIKALVRSRVPLVSVIVTLNGATVFKQAISGSRYILDFPTPLRPGKNLVEIIARNEKSSSAPVTTTIDYKPGRQSSKPNLAVLAIGVSRSRSPGLSPKVAVANAQAFAKLMSTQAMEGGIFGNVQTRVLVDEEVTRESILRSLKWLQSQNQSPNDVIMLFLSGNLAATYVDSSVYFLTSKYNAKSDVELDSVRYPLFWQLLDSGEGNALVFADTGWAEEGPKFVLERFMQQSGKNERINSYFSSADGVLAFLDERSIHSAFTTALLEGLQGKADLQTAGKRADRIIDTHELQFWMRVRIEELTNGKQVSVSQVGPKRVAIFKLPSP
jgi:hypothetical protein